MKKSFMTGLAILLPLALTFLIIRFFVNLLTRPFAGTIEEFLSRYELSGSFLLFSREEILRFSSKFIILLMLFLLILLIGYIAKNFVIHYFFKFNDYIFHRIPFVNKIYKAIQDVIHTILAPKSNNFSQVVLAPFPNETTHCLGLITRDSLPIQSKENSELFSVFIPGTPNPLMGFMLMFKKEQLIFLEMSVEEAMKFIVSCGIVLGDSTATENTLNE